MFDGKVVNSLTDIKSLSLVVCSKPKEMNDKI